VLDIADATVDADADADPEAGDGGNGFDALFIAMITETSKDASSFGYVCGKRGTHRILESSKNRDTVWHQGVRGPSKLLA